MPDTEEIGYIMNTSATYKCPNCGAGMTFDADKQLFICDFCNSSFTESELKKANESQERKFKEAENDTERGSAENAAAANEEFNKHMNEYVCDNCGARVIADENTAASFCYYCHNPVTLVGKLSGNFRPDRIIPFKYGKKEAEEKFLKFASKKKFVPRGFFAKAQIEKISGVYYPFWITDANVAAEIKANATKRVSWISGSMKYVRITYFDVFRAGDIHFEDVTTSASKNEDKNLIEGILPFPSEALMPFSAPYLSGFTAKKRDLSSLDLADEVRYKMLNYSSEILKADANKQNYTTVTVNHADINIKDSKWEYGLCPVWVLTYRKRNKKKDKVYTYGMNGHTGKVYGELPVSVPKLALLFTAIAAPLTALLTFLGGLIF